MDFKQIDMIANQAKELDRAINDLDPAMLHEVFRLVLAGRSNEELLAIIDAAKDRYQRITGREIWDKVPKFEVSVKRK